ncbi:MAG: hypothetical protein IJV06_02920 [Bacteroidaceae bacterium]|nr:hypothetical protein [Bacteroidaceae bacterium]
MSAGSAFVIHRLEELPMAAETPGSMTWRQRGVARHWLNRIPGFLM